MPPAGHIQFDGMYECAALSAYSDLVTAYSKSLISFADYEDYRRQRLAELKQRLAPLTDAHGSVRSPRPRVRHHAVYRLRGPATGPPHGAIWLTAAPLSPRPCYPPVLDLLEAARTHHADEPLLDTLCSAVAPSWEELERFGITSAAGLPRWDDIHGGHGDNVYERYLLGTIALIVASLGSDFGVYLPEFDPRDAISREFLARLMREAPYTGLRIAVHVNDDVALPAELAGLADAPVIESFGSGAPAAADPGPPIDPSPSGWGYLRRAGAIRESGSPSAILAQHAPLAHGLRAIGRDYLVDHYRVLCAPEVLAALPDENRAYALMGAGRLLAISRRQQDADVIALYEQARAISRQPLRAYITYSIANTHAARREPEALAAADTLYADALARLAEIPRADDRLYSEIRFRNGLALVRYIQERNEEAYQLERQCLDLAREAQHQFPEILEWARDVLDANTARLVERRFSDAERAAELLAGMLAEGGPGVREHARSELSRLRFDAGRHQETIDLLQPAYGSAAQHWFDEPRELLSRLLLAASCLALGRIEEAGAQRDRIAYLCHAVGTPASLAFLDALQASEPAVT